MLPGSTAHDWYFVQRPAIERAARKSGLVPKRISVDFWREVEAALGAAIGLYLSKLSPRLRRSERARRAAGISVHVVTPLRGRRVSRVKALMALHEAGYVNVAIGEDGWAYRPGRKIEQAAERGRWRLLPALLGRAALLTQLCAALGKAPPSSHESHLKLAELRAHRTTRRKLAEVAGYARQSSDHTGPAVRDIVHDAHTADGNLYGEPVTRRGPSARSWLRAQLRDGLFVEAALLAIRRIEDELDQTERKLVAGLRKALGDAGRVPSEQLQVQACADKRTGSPPKKRRRGGPVYDPNRSDPAYKTAKLATLKAKATVEG